MPDTTEIPKTPIENWLTELQQLAAELAAEYLTSGNDPSAKWPMLTLIEGGKRNG